MPDGSRGSPSGRSRTRSIAVAHTVWCWENGQRTPRNDSLLLLAELYGVPVTWLDGSDASSLAEANDAADWADTSDRSEPPAGQPLLESLRGRCIVDAGAYRQIMAATSLSQVQELLPSSETGFCYRLSLPISSDCEIVPWRQAEVMEKRLVEKVKELLEDRRR